ncbi:metal-binding, possibly nucleic acid-binding protein [Legionella lansingensis]|uniref:Large ribosomal RNA subunit accumulation protein YceD n=1 Tax=Legionella lansingensis TaxID=45067 RepID=A0A0W0VQ97_9GAMM|nr:YceD family protein [Legionella lansingensis]KTD22302.1 metal-binding protein [Legionella lansingensis]SNV50696.1 metal-binding, possibly nucleic acid-binding protein [Legionella lansingensis]
MMLINLKTLSAKAEGEHIVLELRERLPTHLISPCTVNCHFSVEKCNDYYLLHLNVESNLGIICQRCLQEFSYHYDNTSELAIVSCDEMADKLMEQFECVVADNNQVDLKELVTDELHLYIPELHAKSSDCDHNVDKFIGVESAIKSKLTK